MTCPPSNCCRPSEHCKDQRLRQLQSETAGAPPPPRYAKNGRMDYRCPDSGVSPMGPTTRERQAGPSRIRLRGLKTAGELAPSVAPKRQRPTDLGSAVRHNRVGCGERRADGALGDLCGLPTEDRSEPGVSQRGTSLKPASLLPCSFKALFGCRKSHEYKLSDENG